MYAYEYDYLFMLFDRMERIQVTLYEHLPIMHANHTLILMEVGARLQCEGGEVYCCDD
jgi:hypothetical protein